MEWSEGILWIKFYVSIYTCSNKSNYICGLKGLNHVGTCERIVFLRICVELLWLRTCNGNCVESKHKKSMFILILSFQVMLSYSLLAFGVLPTPLISGPWPLSGCQSALLNYLLGAQLFLQQYIFEPLAHTWFIHHHSLSPIWRIPSETLSWLGPWLHLLTSL